MNSKTRSIAPAVSAHCSATAIWIWRLTAASAEPAGLTTLVPGTRDAVQLHPGVPPHQVQALLGGDRHPGRGGRHEQLHQAVRRRPR